MVSKKNPFILFICVICEKKNRRVDKLLVKALTDETENVTHRGLKVREYTDPILVYNNMKATYSHKTYNLSTCLLPKT